MDSEAFPQTYARKASIKPVSRPASESLCDILATLKADVNGIVLAMPKLSRLEKSLDSIDNSLSVLPQLQEQTQKLIEQTPSASATDDLVLSTRVTVLERQVQELVSNAAPSLQCPVIVSQQLTPPPPPSMSLIEDADSTEDWDSFISDFKPSGNSRAEVSK
jgi:hypothetical protein